MRFHPLSVRGSFLMVPDKLTDSRGCFYESFRHEEIAVQAGYPFTLAQTNFSVSSRGVLRGIHATTVPPGQTKIVTCHRGAVLDVVVDIRLGSPTFGEHDRTVLRAQSGHSVFLSDGLGHGFVALADDTCVGYLCSTRYVPGTQIDINPLDPDLAVDWGPADRLILSDKDRYAPDLARAAKAGVLPTHEECHALYERLRGGNV